MRPLQRQQYRFPLVTKKHHRKPKSMVVPDVGDIVFARSNGIMGRAIRLGERLRWRRGSKWNHVAIVSHVHNGVAYVTQAEPSGVTNDKRLSTIGECLIVKPPVTVSSKKTLEFISLQVGHRYSFLSILSIFFDILTPNWFPAFRRDNTWICSSLVAESLRFGGYLHNWADIYTVTPAQLFEALSIDKKRT